jgi:hypothetical protein
VDYQETTEGENESGGITAQTPQSQGTAENICEDCRQQIMDYGQQFQGFIIERANQNEGQEIGWIERGGLHIGQEGASPVKMRVPERYDPLLPLLSSEGINWIQEGRQVTTTPRNHDIRQKDELPEKAKYGGEI